MSVLESQGSMNRKGSCHLYNIPAWQPFARTLAAYLLQQTQGRPEALTRYKLLLPTRRTCRVMRETFLSLNEGKALLLPQMSALGDVDEESLSLMMFGQSGAFLDVLAVLSPLKRQLLLTRLICAMPDYAQSSGHALVLARALGKFIDDVLVEGADFADLCEIVPEEFSAHWQITLDFLRIISEVWPQILAENQAIDAAEHRNRMLHLLSQHWQNSPPDGPVIAAGSSGSIPAAAELLRTVSMLDEGMVVLPGLDQEMESDDWDVLQETHPQHSLKTLLQRVGMDREDVQDIKLDAEVSGVSGDFGKERHKLASAMMLPARSTYKWPDFAHKADLHAMCEGLEYYQCATQSEEAGVISLIMREALEDERCVCALVTPDRTLARRVKSFCRRWGIELDDSAGLNLTETPQGKLALLCLDAVKEPFDAVSVLALFKTSLCCFGYEKEAVRLYTAQLEKVILRQGLVITTHAKFQNIVQESDLLSDEVKRFVLGFYEALSPLLARVSVGGLLNAQEVLKAHIASLEALALKKEEEEALSGPYWAGDSGRQMSQFFVQMLEYASLIEDLSFEDYGDVLATLMRDVTLRVAYGSHPRLLILGQLEARLTKADIVILGGLNEGVWPGDPGHDPWMSRPMRKNFGLPAREQMIGFSAHDFVQGFSSERVIMTRTHKIDGAPMLPSRWLDRLDTILQAGDMSINDLAKGPYLSWLRELDDAPVVPCKRPMPCPPLKARPKGISVTKVDVWLKDPYSIYLHYVLKLRKLRPLHQDNDAALKGVLLHKILERFTHAFPAVLPENAQEEFLNIARDVLEHDAQDKIFMQGWWPRLTQMAAWIVENECSWRSRAQFFASEVKGNIDLNIDGVPFNLHGIADRVDKLAGGSYALIDYKSGGAFSKFKLQKGELPQLPLEALILEGGGFDGRGFGHNAVLKQKDVHPASLIRSGQAGYLGYWKISGAQEAGQIFSIEGELSDVVQKAREGLETLVRTYRDEAMSYCCLPDTARVLRYYDYELISRVKEWSVLEEQEGGYDEE